MKLSEKRMDYSLSTGRVAEVRFRRACEHMGLLVKKASRETDMKHHIDFFMSQGDKTWSADVKGNNLPDEIYCEFINVRGDKGWMQGAANVIAFDMPEVGGFCIVKRMELLEWCNRNVEDVFVTHRRDAYRKKYTRPGRRDVITKIHIEDLISMDSYRVLKYKPI